MTRPLEPSTGELRALLDTARDYVTGVLDALPDAPVSDMAGIEELLADPEIRRPPPEHGRPLAELLAVVDRAASKGFNPSSPGYFAFVPGSGLVAAAIADLVADVLNRYTGLAFPSPALVTMENDVLRWLLAEFGLPERGAGVLTTGGSLATFSAVVTARATKLPEDFLGGTLYATERAHLSVAKAARLAGFPARALRLVPVDADLRMDVGALRAMVRADRDAGHTPFCVVANAGSTDTGTVDPLPAIADVAAAEGLWLHADAAYGGFFQLTARGRATLQGIERADSVVLDPHKGLFLPFGTGALLVRDGAALRLAHSGETGEYLRDLSGTALPSFGEYGPELTRDFRGLRLWLPLHLHGVAAFRAALDEKLDLGAHAYEVLRADPHLDVPWRPDLSTVAFAHRSGDDATAAVLAGVNAEQRAQLSSTRIGDRVFARISVLNHRTDRARVDEALDAVRRYARPS